MDGKEENVLNKKKSKRGLLLGVVISIMAIFICLITGFEIAAYGNYGFYEKEYEKYQVTEALDMEMDDVMTVTKYMMSYLKGKEETLSIESTIEGKRQDFFNEQDRFHMGEVLNLFLKGILLRRIAIVILVVAFVALKWKDKEWKVKLAKAYEWTLGVAVLLFGTLGIAISMNFTRCFTIFHEIFFDNDLWLFDAQTDYMIRMLPEGFFFDMVIRIGGFFAGFLIVLLIIAEVVRRKNINKKNL